MWRLFAYPCFAAEWLWKWWHGYCRPHCQNYDVLNTNHPWEYHVANGIPVRCKDCGRSGLI